jgi:hypothetical protein
VVGVIVSGNGRGTDWVGPALVGGARVGRALGVVVANGPQAPATRIRKENDAIRVILVFIFISFVGRGSKVPNPEFPSCLILLQWGDFQFGLTN